MAAFREAGGFGRWLFRNNRRLGGKRLIENARVNYFSRERKPGISDSGISD
jgi:hypothetical protein